MRKILIFIFVLFFCGCATTFNAKDSINPNHPDFVLVKVISRPVPKKNEVIPSSAKGFRHMAIVSDILPYGVWEVGPDENGNIVTTHTVTNISEWREHKITQKCIELGGDYIRLQLAGVNKQGLLDSLKLYEENWVGEKYSRYSYNENYAVESVIYGAGGNLNK